ncbi:MAG: glycosyltransferase [Nitrososphaeria archaeon]
MISQALTSISISLLALILLWMVYQLLVILVGFKNNRMLNKKDVAYYPKFSIIIPTKNEEKVIERCLNSIIALNYPQNLIEIIVVDSSNDSTGKVCEDFEKRYPSLIKVIRNDPKGKPSALNVGLKHAKGEIVGVFDADSILAENTILNAAVYFQDPHIVAVQGRTRCLNRNHNLLTRLQTIQEEIFFHLLIRGRDLLNLFIPFTGSCLFIRRNVLEELGGWNNFSLAEDVELSARLLLNKDARIKYAEDVISWQETPSRLKALIRQKSRWYRGYIETAIKYSKLLKKPSIKNFEAETFISSPIIMILSFLGYINWIIGLLYPSANIIFQLIGYLIIIATLLSIILTVACLEKPLNLRNLMLTPFVYIYWILQSIIALKCFLEIIFRRPREWLKTEKEGIIAP